MPNSEKLNKLILIGFKKPSNEDKRSPELTERLLKEVANIDDVNIASGEKTLLFFDVPSEDKIVVSDAANIVRESFIADESKPTGFKIGNARCILSESLSRKQSRIIEKIGKLGVKMSESFQDVDFSLLTQQQMHEWFDNGFVKTAKDSDEEGSRGELDVFDEILGVKSPSHNEDSEGSHSRNSSSDSISVMDLVNSQMGSEEDKRSEDTHHQNMEDDIRSGAPRHSDLTGSDEPVHNNPYLDDDKDDEDYSAPMGDNSQHSESDESVNHVARSRSSAHALSHRYSDDDISHDVKDKEPQSEHNSSEEKDRSHNDNPYLDSDSDDFDYQEGKEEEKRVDRNQPHEYDDDTGLTPGNDRRGLSSSDNHSQSQDNTLLQEINRDRNREEERKMRDQIIEDELDRYANKSDYEEQEYVPGGGIEDSDSRRLSSMEDESYDTPEYKTKSSKDSKTLRNDPINSTSDDLIEEIKRNRQRAKRREREGDKSLREARKARDEKLAQSAKKKSIGSRSSDLNRKIDSDMEDRFKEDGTVKTYKDYLSPEGRENQDIAERMAEKFSNADLNYSQDRGEGYSYVGRRSGRVVLVTAGKGGVGKTLFTCAAASALSLARAKEREDNPGTQPRRVWLIESDYLSPKLRQVYKTGDKHLGNVAELLNRNDGMAKNSKAIFQAIEDNVYVDEETGINVLACPPINRSNSSVKNIPYTIVAAIKSAIDNGGDVFIDHGQLTSGNYSELDNILAFKLSNRVVVVSNMSCINETTSTLDLLAGVRARGSGNQKNRNLINVVLNSATDEQLLIAKEKLRPFIVVGRIPRIPALAPENSMTGDTYFTNASLDVRKEVIVRAGQMLKNMGYSDLSRYFYRDPGIQSRKGNVKNKKPWFQRITDRIIK